MVPDIKICGLKTAEAIEAAIAGGVTHCGFIFFAASPRHLETDAAAALREIVGDRAKTVAVTVDAENAYLDKIVDLVKPGMLQLHGGESPGRVAEVKVRYGLPVMKAFSICRTGDVAGSDRYRGVADRFLFDAMAPEGSEVPGGHGVAFDWALLDSLDPAIEYMLSGGVNAANVAKALSHVRPAGLDVSSGVENAPGVKDTALIAAFFEALNEAVEQTE